HEIVSWARRESNNAGEADPTACQYCGRDSCDGTCRAAASPARRPPRLTAHTAREVMAMPRPTAIIEGIAWAGRVSVLASESGAGKTFVLLDQAAHVSAGLTYHGRAVTQGPVVYLAYEADDLGRRLRALHDVGGHRLDHVHVVYASDPLSPVLTR